MSQQNVLTTKIKIKSPWE